MKRFIEEIPEKNEEMTREQLVKNLESIHEHLDHAKTCIAFGIIALEAIISERNEPREKYAVIRMALVKAYSDIGGNFEHFAFTDELIQEEIDRLLGNSGGMKS